MKTKSICTLILLTAILIGCTDASRKGAPVTIDLQHQEIPLPDLIIGGPAGIVKKGNFLLVLDRSTRYFYHLIDLNTHEYKGKFVTVGQGPDELNRPEDVHSLDGSPFIYSMDHSVGIVRL